MYPYINLSDKTEITYAENISQNNSFNLNQMTIDRVKEEVTEMIKAETGNALKSIILYGSCARGDYNDDSDIDIAVLFDADRSGVEDYLDGMSLIATKLALKYIVVANIICLPYEEYLNKRTWYKFFRNIDREGEILYGTEVL